MLFSADAWRMCTLEAYYTLDYSNAGDHLGITMVTHSPLEESPPPRQGYESVAHWPQSLFQKVKRHMTIWSKAHRYTDCAPVARAGMIRNEITPFVIQHPRKEPEIDPREQALHSAIILNPRSPYALHDWAAYMGDKEMRGTHKALQRFRRNAHHRGKNFFRSLQMWLLNPFSYFQPTTNRRICTAASPPFFW